MIRMRDIDVIDHLQDFVDAMADECGGYSVLTGLLVLLFLMLVFVAAAR